jgi:hypothetical protein
MSFITLFIESLITLGNKRYNRDIRAASKSRSDEIWRNAINYVCKIAKLKSPLLFKPFLSLVSYCISYRQMVMDSKDMTWTDYI